MSETTSRPLGSARGRGSGRGGRGGFPGRSGRGGSRQTNGAAQEDTTETSNVEDEGDIGALKSRYAGKIEQIKEMFPDWTEQDIAFALEDNTGDLELTVERITEGMHPRKHLMKVGYC